MNNDTLIAESNTIYCNSPRAAVLRPVGSSTSVGATYQTLENGAVDEIKKLVPRRAVADPSSPVPVLEKGIGCSRLGILSSTILAFGSAHYCPSTQLHERPRVTHRDRFMKHHICRSEQTTTKKPGLGAL